MKESILDYHEVRTLFERLLPILGPDVVGLLLIELARSALKKQLTIDSRKMLQEVLDELIAERVINPGSGSPYR